MKKLESDIDIAIFGEVISFSTIARLHYRLEEEGPLPYFFDIVDLRGLEKPSLKGKSGMERFAENSSGRICLRIPEYPDGESGGIRTLFRQHADSNPEASGHLSVSMIIFLCSFYFNNRLSFIESGSFFPPLLPA